MPLIRVSKRVKRRLVRLKFELGARSLNEVIRRLIDMYEGDWLALFPKRVWEEV